MKKPKPVSSSTLLKNVVTSQPKPLQTDSTMKEAGETMRELASETFPVASGSKVVGSVQGSHPDRRVAAFGHDPETSRVCDNMSAKVIYCFEDQTTSEAREIMKKNGLSHLPVVDHQLRILGIVSLADLDPKPAAKGSLPRRRASSG